MPGLYGYCVGNGLKKGQIEGVSKAMKLYEHFIQDGIYDGDRVSASRIHLGKIGEKFSPLIKSENYLWLEGEAYNHKEIAKKLSLKGNNFSEILLEAYIEDKLEIFLNELDGYFCAALYDERNQLIKLISDRYGMRLLYWYEKDGEFAWSSEVKGMLALQGIDKTVDEESLDCFMNLGYLLGEHTWFKYIRLIKPATIVTFNLNSKKVTQKYYWNWSEIEPSKLNFDDAVDELGRRFIRAVEKRFDKSEKIGVALSGGLDSRAIFAAIEKISPDFEGYAYTFGVPNCDDILIAEQVLKGSNWKHQKFYFTNLNWLGPRLEKIWNTDGMQDMMHMHGGEFIDNVSENIDINLNGYAGDAIFGGGFLRKIPKNSRANEVNCYAFYKSYSRLANIDDEIYDVAYVEPNLYMNRVRRFTNMGTVNSLIAVEQRKPFFDNECVELVFSLPESYREGNKLYSVMLQKYFANHFGEIPWQQTGKPAGIIVDRSLIRRALGKGIRTIEGVLGKKSSKNYTDYASWIRSPEVGKFLQLLLEKNSSEYSKLTDMDYKKTYLDPHLLSRSKNYSNEILRAATVEIYFRGVGNRGLPQLTNS